MYDVPFVFGPIVDPTTVAFMAFTNVSTDLSLGFATWLALAGVVLLALLPVAFRTSAPKRLEHSIVDVELREAA